MCSSDLHADGFAFVTVLQGLNMKNSGSPGNFAYMGYSSATAQALRAIEQADIKLDVVHTPRKDAPDFPDDEAHADFVAYDIAETERFERTRLHLIKTLIVDLHNPPSDLPQSSAASSIVQQTPTTTEKQP